MSLHPFIQLVFHSIFTRNADNLPNFHTPNAHWYSVSSAVSSVSEKAVAGQVRINMVPISRVNPLLYTGGDRSMVMGPTVTTVSRVALLDAFVCRKNLMWWINWITNLIPYVYYQN